MIKMTRCDYLESWFDNQSQRIDTWEKENNAKFLDIGLTKGRLWNYLLNFGQN